MAELVLPRVGARRRHRRPVGPMWRVSVAAVATMLACLAWNLVDLHQPAELLFAAADGAWTAAWWPVLRRRGYPPLDSRWLSAGFALAGAGIASGLLG